MIIERKSYIDRINNAISRLPVVILIGARQVGKTSLMECIKPKKSSLMLNGQDSETAEIFQKQSTIEQFLKLKLNKDINGFLFIDEFQYIQGISTQIKLLSDKYKKLKIICSGSSSIDVLQKVDETLAGRVRVIPVYALSFEEYLLFKDAELHENYLEYDLNTVDTIVNRQIQLIFKEFLLFGGMPRVTLENEHKEKIELLDDIYKTYLLKDVRSYVHNEDFVGYNKLIRSLAAQTGQLVNINELSRISGLTYKKAEEYLHLLEQMYIIKLLEPFETNERKVISKMKKVYFTDTGLRNIILNSFQDIDFRIDNGHIFENCVLLEILKHSEKSLRLNYYRTIDGSEVDFVINTPKKKTSVEVKYTSYKKPVSLKNLLTFNKHQKIKNSYVINNSLNIIEGKVHFIQGYLAGKIIFM